MVVGRCSVSFDGRGPANAVDRWPLLARRIGRQPDRYRSRSHQPLELTVAGAVPDIMDFVTRVVELGSGMWLA